MNRAPVWLSRLVIDAMHHDQLLEHGGLPGLRDENALEAALARPQHRFEYEPDADLAALAAAYGYGLATSHPYSDGNKRLAFVAMGTFLGLNGWEIEAAEPAVVAIILRVAAGRTTEEELAAWVRTHLAPRPEDAR